MTRRIASLDTYDVRFPTSRGLHGSDAMNPDPDYSAAYVVIRAEQTGGAEGHGFAFTIGRGNDVQAAAIRALEPFLVGLELDPVLADLGPVWMRMVRDPQLRWLGPEKGVMHMAIAAVTNALWDLKAKLAGKPVWQVLADASPEELVALADFRYLTDVLTPGEALRILRSARPGRAEREQRLLSGGYPAYTTSAGWLGYSDSRLVHLTERAVADGFRMIKIKVGAGAARDRHRLRLVRETAGAGVRIAVDANQAWDVPAAIAAIRDLSEFGLYWVEEPTSPDDVLGHAEIRRAVAPVRIATGEHVANRVMFKQFLQAGAIDVVQIDATRVAGVNENIAILLLAAKFGVPVCPHAGGVGLCELVQHLAIFDYLAVSGSLEDRMIEYVDHLHEHFADPVTIADGSYRMPLAPGFSAQLRAESLAGYLYPSGPEWRRDA